MVGYVALKVKWMAGQIAVLFALVVAICTAPHAMAQDGTALADQPPLIVGVSPFPPYNVPDENGAWTGFSADLAYALSEETGIAITFMPFTQPLEVLDALNTGEIDTIIGLAKLPMVSESTVYSTPIFTESLRLIAKPDMAETLSGNAVEGLRIGVWTQVRGPEVESLLSRNITVNLGSDDAALIAFLMDEVDLLLAPNSVVYGRVRASEIEHLFGFVDPPVRTVERFVALHKSRADLLPAINEAIARIQADGRLGLLARQYGIEVPPPPPAVLRVPVGNAPPWSVVEGDEITGFVPELIAELAERADLAVEFVPVSVEEYFRATATASEDMIPFVQVTDANNAVLDLTYPVISAPTDIIVRDQDSHFQTPADLMQARVGTVAASTGSMLEGIGIAAAEWVVVGDFDALFAALRAGDVDAIATSATAPVNADAAPSYRIISPPGFAIDVAIGLRPGLGAIRERLDAVIPGYLLSGHHTALQQAYFAPPVFWTRARIYGGLGAIGLLFLVLLGGLFWQRLKQRGLVVLQQQRELAREKAHTEELGQLVSALELSNRNLDDFAYIASHDLKEPLRGIGINADFLLREDLPEKARERAGRMRELTGRMEQLISDLLFFSRLGSGDKARVKVAPHEIIQSIRADLAEWLHEHNAEIVETGRIPSLRVESVKCKIVLQNLITNAVKYNDADIRRVEIGFAKEVTVHGEQMRDVIFVKDNGIGISDIHRDKVFRIFSRLNTKGKYAVGSGSGLAFVRRIVEEHGGKIDFASTLGVGSTFYIGLPLAEQD